jgi:hypothetical protein
MPFGPLLPSDVGATVRVWDDDPAKRRTDVYFLLAAPAAGARLAHPLWRWRKVRVCWLNSSTFS